MSDEVPRSGRRKPTISRVERKRDRPSSVTTKTTPVFWSALALTVVVGVVAYFGQLRIETVLKQRVKGDLEARLASAVAGARLWFDVCERAHEAIRSDGRLADAVSCLQSAGDACAMALHGVVDSYAASTGGELFLIDAGEGHAWRFPGGELSTDEVARLLEQLNSLGSPLRTLRFMPPFKLSETRSTSGFVSQLGPSMFLFTEVPPSSLSNVLAAARGGESSETYALNSSGQMVTQSRFLPDLRLAGLLRPQDRSSVLEVEIRDPGVNLAAGERTGVLRSEQPLTEMAASVTSGQSGVNTEGYRDYRGVDVVGAWRWMPRYQLGITTETDREEELAALSTLRMLFFGMVGLLATVCVGLAVTAAFALRMRRRAARALTLNRELGQYKIERKLGEGGMGTVYLATHAMLGRPTAVKIVRPERATEETLERFQREVRATSELAHPNTVSIYDYGAAEDGTFYYAMEYLEGLDLEVLVERFGKLPQTRVVHFLIQVCGSLAEAHARNLVHRDIKPSNLFVCRREALQDVVKVLDFGLVTSNLAERSRITRGSTILGTPEYMSPEMFDSARAVGPPSDIYSLGAVAYYMLTGRTLFDAPTMAQLCAAHLTSVPPPPSEYVDEVLDPDLERLVLACLEKTPAGRPSAERLRELLLGLTCAGQWTAKDARQFWHEVDEGDCVTQSAAGVG